MLRKKSYGGRISLPDKTYYKTSKIKSISLMCREVGQWNRMENPEIDSSVNGYLIYGIGVILNHCHRNFPGGAVVKNLPANAGDIGLIPGPGRSHMLWSN